MATTVQDTINFSQPFIQYSPLAVGVANQPALGIANEIQYTVFNAPFTWAFNRAEIGPLTNNSLILQPGVQDYVVAVTDFSFMETATTTDPDTGETFNIDDVYNTKNLSRGDASLNKRGRPNSISTRIINFGTSITVRFLGVPDKAYIVSFTYQKLIAPLTSLTGATGTWTIPDQYQDIYNNLFLAEAMVSVDDAKSTQYRQRGITALLAKAEGLNDMQKNAFLEQYWARYGRFETSGSLKTQQGVQARAV